MGASVGEIDFWGAIIKGSLLFQGIHVENNLRIGPHRPTDEGLAYRTRILGEFDFREATIDGRLELHELLLAPALRVVDLSNSVIHECTIEQPPDPLFFDFEDATIGKIDVKNAANSFRYQRLHNTRFDEVDFSTDREYFSAVDWKIHPLARRDVFAAAEEYDAARADADGLYDELVDHPAIAENLADGGDLEAGLTDLSPISTTIVDEDGIRVTREVPLLEELDHDEIRQRIRRVAQATMLDSREHPLARRWAVQTLTEALVDARMSAPERDVETLEAIETTYLNAKNVASSQGDNQSAGEFFRNEMYFRRKVHWQRFREALSAVSVTQLGGVLREAVTRKSPRAAVGGTNLWTAVSHGIRWLENTTLRFTSGYGERPSYVLGISVGIVVACTGIFSLLGAATPHPGLYGDLVLSLESFVTLVLVSQESLQPVPHLIAQIEGFTGLFLVALFVYTLTQSIDR